MYKLLREILFELKGIKKELHIIASNTESCNVTTNIHGHYIKDELDAKNAASIIISGLREKINQF